MWPNDENEKNSSGQFVDGNLYSTNATVYEQTEAGVNSWDDRESAARKVNEFRTPAYQVPDMPVVKLDTPKFEPPTFSTPIQSTPAPIYSAPTSESRSYPPIERAKDSPRAGHVNVGDTKSPAKNPAQVEKTKIPTAKMPLGVRIRATFSWVLKMAATCVLLLIVLIIYSSDWAKSISKKWENEAAINVFGSEQVAPMSVYASLTEKLGKAPTFDVKKLVTFAASRNRASTKRGSNEYLMYAATSWNCISQDANCAREIYRVSPNAVAGIRALGFDWLNFANESGNRDAAADLGLYSLKGAWGAEFAGVQSALNFWQSGKYNNEREDRLSRLMQKYASSTDLSVLRWVRDTQGTVSKALFKWMP